MRARMRLTIVLDTLENLRRGGRADGFIAIVDRMARALNIKPVINVVDGQLRLLGAARSFPPVKSSHQPSYRLDELAHRNRASDLLLCTCSLLCSSQPTRSAGC
jgi:hypothetical protein